MRKEKYIFRCKEQGEKMWISEEIYASTLHEACSLLANKWILTYGVGTVYLWVISITHNGSVIYYGPKRMNDILFELNSK